MNELNVDSSDSFEELKKAYYTNLPLSINNLDSQFKALLNKKLGKDEYSILRTNVHKIAGSAGSFGYTEISNILKEVDQYLAGLTEEEAMAGNINKNYIKESLKNIKNNIERKQTPSRKETHKETHIVTTKPAFHGKLFGKNQGVWDKNIILCNPENKKYLNEIKVRMSYFGYNIEYHKNMETVLKNADPEKYYLLIADIDSMVAEPGDSEQFTNYKKEFSFLKIIFISERNDFETRLFAFRSGGDAFFGLPVNTIKLVDKIEYFADNRRIKPDHVLIVDDDIETLSYYAELFQHNGMITSVTTDPASVFDLIIEAEPDLMLIDVFMNSCSGIELASVIRQHEEFVSIPLILYSAYAKPPDIDVLMPLAGDEYINKGIADEEFITFVRNKIKRSKSLRYFMERDSLTGLLNHANLNDGFYRELLRSERMQLPLAYVMIDLDNFKIINDKYGHLIGDTVLKSLACMLMERLRSTDLLGRYGGEEFVIIMNNTSIVNAKKVVDEIRISFSEIYHKACDESFNVTFSCGIAGYPELKLAEKISEAADKALYKAKETGKNKVVIYEETG